MRRAVALLSATALAIVIGMRGVADEWSESRVYGFTLLAVVLIVAVSAPVVLRSPKPQRRLAGAGVDPRATFADVAGVDEAIEELAEVLDYLGSPEKFLAMGATVPKGILLTGPPGCGKTLLAHALAGEANVPFFSISGSELVESFAGVGARRIRGLFTVAESAAPCIVFIDELDEVSRGRAEMAVGGQDEWETSLNYLLAEVMDGLEPGSGVIVLAASNRPDVLDPALLRRFDSRVAIDYPDIQGREGVLKIHSRGKPLSSKIDMAAVAKRTVGFSGADLARVVNEAARLAARRGSTEIEAKHMFEAIERVAAGPERNTRILTPQDRYRIAFHEAGHAVAATALPGTDRVESCPSWPGATPAASSGTSPRPTTISG